MPNWCECDLVVTGPEGDLAKFREKAQGTEGPFYSLNPDQPLCADSFIPYPEELRKLDEAYEQAKEDQGTELPADEHGHPMKDSFNQGGSEWCVEHWGTKWGICNPRLIEDDSLEGLIEEASLPEGHGRLAYQFLTAWSPPLPVVLAMSKAFPTLVFDLRYYEGGAGFQGHFRAVGGQVIINKCEDYLGPRGG